MKVFIVFLALMLILTGFLLYTADLYTYLRMQSQLKTAAEECACAAVLMLDSETYRTGTMVIDEKAAVQAAELIAKQSCTGLLRKGTISLQLQVFDEEKGYQGTETFGISKDRPAAFASLTYSGPDCFRLPFINASQITRSAVYQWEFGLTSH